MILFDDYQSKFPSKAIFPLFIRKVVITETKIETELGCLFRVTSFQNKFKNEKNPFNFVHM